MTDAPPPTVPATADPLNIPPDADTPVNLIDPKLKTRALRQIQGLVKGNGVKADEVILEDCTAQVFAFQARTLIKLSPQYAMRVEPGLNKIAELIATAEEFRQTLDSIVMTTRTDPVKRQIVTDFLFARTDRGFGCKDQKVRFKKLESNYVLHEGCAACARIGKIKCQRCGADGMLICPHCQGRRKITCPQCRSTGQVAQGGRHRTCERCQGQGRIDCTACRGRGQIACQTCGGKGMARCEKCASTGWFSQLAKVEMEAQIHFDFDRRGLPLELVKMIEAFGARLVEKGDLEVSLGLRQLMPGQQEAVTEPADMIFVDYDAKVPYGAIRFRMKDRIIPAIMFGYHGKIIEAPGFLDDLTSKGQQVLAEAAAGNGNIAEKIHRAAKYRLLCDVILEAAGKHAQSKSLSILTARYPAGILPERLLALLLQAAQALQTMTRKPRIYGLLAGLGLTLAGEAAYLPGGGRLQLKELGLPEAALMLIDGLLLAAGSAAGVYGSQIFSMLAQRRALGGLVTSTKLIQLMPRSGQLVWVATLASAVLMATFLIVTGLYRPDQAPLWILTLLKSLQ